MSLEEKIAANTAATEANTAATEANTAATEANTKAIDGLIAAWKKLTSAAVDAADSVAAGEGLAAGGKVVVKPGKPAAGKGSPDAQTASSKQEKESPAVTRPDMSAAIVSLCAKHGRPAALEVLKPYGATKGAEVKDEDIAAVHAAVTAALEADKPEDMS